MQLIPASIVVALRQARPAPEILLVHRNPELPVQGGAWALPGGRIAVRDGSMADNQRLTTAQACAVREVREETALHIEASSLALLARWITPAELTTRFSTWIFITAGSKGTVEVDGGEIIGHRWCTARQALTLHHQRRIHLTPPVFVILSNLTAYTDIDTILEKVNQQPPAWFEPRLVTLQDGSCALYREDVAYTNKDLARQGPRHRLWMRPSGWLYECRF